MRFGVRKRRLFGARDAAGTRHFYYHAGNGWFGFASEIKGLLALERIEPRLNESRLLDYLVVEFDRDDEVGTFYQDINRMPAGHAMWSTEFGARTWRYWNPGNLPAMSYASLDECAEAFLEQLRVAVKCRLRSIGPVGAMLSGGLDSSSIVGLISKEFRNDLRQPLRTFSLIRHDRENCSDWLSIREMVTEGWFEPTIITSAIPHEFCRTFLDQIPAADEPFLFSHGLNAFLLYQAAQANGCRVALDGMAGDLLFYRDAGTLDAIFRTRNFTRIPAMLAAYRRHGFQDGIKKLIRKSLASVAPQRARAIYRRQRDKRALRRDDLKLLQRETARHLLATRYAQRRQAVGDLNIDNDQIGHARYFTSGLLSFAHEVYGQIALSGRVEPRSPYSDRRMIEFAIRMPVEAKLFTPWYKHLLRKSMDGILPEQVRWRRDIGGHPGWKFYEQLISDMVRHAPEIWHPERLGSTLKQWFDASSLEREWRRYAQNVNYEIGFNLYTLAILARWLSIHPRIMQLR